VTAIAYELAEVNQAFAFGLVLVAGKAPTGDEAKHEWVCKQVLEHGIGIDADCGFEFLELVVTSRLL
jgi:hypothetical protein